MAAEVQSDCRPLTLSWISLDRHGGPDLLRILQLIPKPWWSAIGILDLDQICIGKTRDRLMLEISIASSRDCVRRRQDWSGRIQGQQDPANESGQKEHVKIWNQFKFLDLSDASDRLGLMAATEVAR